MNVLFVIITSFLYSSGSINSSLLTQYDGLEKDYWKWKESFSEKKSFIGRFFQKSPTPTTPEYNESQKKDVCHAFVESYNYVYEEATMQTLVKNAKLTETHLKDSADFNAQDQTQDVKIGSQKDNLKMFQCVADKEGEHVFHLTIAPQKDFFFVISTSKNQKEGGKKKPIFQALFQPSGTIDQEFVRKKEKLHLIFWKKLVQLNTRLAEPVRQSLCAIQEYHHFNLCSVVADKLYRDFNFNEMKIQALNRIRKIPERCVLRTISDTRKQMKDTELDVLPCAVNNEDWSNPQFFLIRDTLSQDLPASVFVLTPERGKESLTLFTRVDNVMVLTMP